MSGYLSKQTLEYDFEGDQIRCVAKHLSRQDALKLHSMMPNKERKLSQEEQHQLFNAFAEVLPNYIDQFTGLKDADGNPVTLQEVCQQFYFLSLLSEIGNDLVIKSLPHPTKPSVNN